MQIRVETVKTAEIDHSLLYPDIEGNEYISAKDNAAPVTIYRDPDLVIPEDELWHPGLEYVNDALFDTYFGARKSRAALEKAITEVPDVHTALFFERMLQELRPEEVIELRHIAVGITPWNKECYLYHHLGFVASQ